MTSISKIVYADKLDDIVNKYNNTYHSTIEIKPVDIKTNTYLDSSKEINDKDPEFKVGYVVRILRYKNVFTKGYTSNWKYCATEMLLIILMEKKLLEPFTKKKNLKKKKKKNQEEFRIEKVI